MTDIAAQSSSPFIVLSMEDYESKLPLLEDMPLKKAKRYIEPLKHQALVGAVLGAFERYPAIHTIKFQDDGTRDSNVSGYHILAHGPGKEDIPTEDHGACNEMALPDLNKLLWWFFDDEDFRADLSQSTFNRDDAVEQLNTLLADECKAWDVSWEDFVQRVYTHLGRPNALEESAAMRAQISDDPTIVELFRTLRLEHTSGFAQALANAPDDLYKARIQAPGLEGTKLAWSPLAYGLMFMLGSDDVRANAELRNTIVYSTHKLPEGETNGFLKLAGPKDDMKTWDPWWADPVAMMWAVSGRCCMAVNSHRRESWSDAMLAWSGDSAAMADVRVLILSIRLAEHAKGSPLFTHAAHRRLKGMIDKIWTVWIDGNSPASDRPMHESFDLMATAILFYGKPSQHMAPWRPDPYDLGTMLGKGPGPVFSKTLSKLPPNLALRLGLATLVRETEKEEIAAAETFLLGLLEGGAALKQDDRYLEKLLGGKGVTDALREKVQATLQ